MLKAQTKMQFLGCLGLASMIAAASPALALDKVSYGTKWLAQAEHGGFYQAVADGTYAKY
ncbi:ABC transporter substrate-binding protein, partial [Rhizobium ruizarguesonis]